MMSTKRFKSGLTWSKTLFGLNFTLILILLISLIISLSSFLTACSTPEVTTQVATAFIPATTTQTSITNETSSSMTATPTTAMTLAKPQGELVAASQTFGNENFLPWLDPGTAPLDDLIYDMLVYWDEVNLKFIPGLAENLGGFKGWSYTYL